MTGSERERGDVAFSSRGIDTLAVACQRKSKTQRNLLAADVSAPDVLDAQGSLHISELGRRVDVLVLRARAEREQQGHKYKTAHQLFPHGGGRGGALVRDQIAKIGRAHV